MGVKYPDFVMLIQITTDGIIQDNRAMLNEAAIHGMSGRYAAVVTFMRKYIAEKLLPLNIFLFFLKGSK